MPETKDLLNPIAAPENAVIGDENLSPRDPDVSTVNESVPAQTTGKPAVEVDSVKVTETVVALDEIITDPHSPLAVQIPDAGRGPLSLPIHRLAEAPKPEDVFSKSAEDDAPAEDPDAE
jgi:hypothetical protein